jgi:molybdenum cofactor guanylyltransferase
LGRVEEYSVCVEATISDRTVSGIILAGGRSLRLGSDKALLELGGHTLVERVIGVLQLITDEVIVVTSTPDRFAHLSADVRFVQDVIPRPSALVGIYSGLLAARHDYSLVVACDMPFLNPDLLRYLVNHAAGCDVVIPRHTRGLEALHACYSRRCIGPMENLMRKEDATIAHFFPEVKVCYVDEPTLQELDPEGLSFYNINTPADWELAQALARQRMAPDQ